MLGRSSRAAPLPPSLPSRTGLLFPAWLRTVRQERDQTQEQLATELGWTRPVYNQIERGAVPPSPAFVTRLATVLALPPGDRPAFRAWALTPAPLTGPAPAYPSALTPWPLLLAGGAGFAARGHVGLARQYLEQAATVAAATGDPEGQAAAALALGRLCAQQLGALDAARAYLTTARAQYAASADPWAPAGLLATLIDLGDLLTAQGDPATGQAVLREALGQARGQADPAARSRVLHGLGWVAFAEGDLWTAAQYQQQALTLARAHGTRADEARALYAQGAVAEQQGDPGARALLIASHHAWLRDGDPTGLARCLNTLALVEHRSGDLPAARAYLEDALLLYAQAPADRRGQIRALHNLGWLEFAVGDLPAARRCLEDALAQAGQAGVRWSEALAGAYLGWVLAAQGQYRAARRTWRRALALSRAQDFPAVAWLGLTGLAQQTASRRPAQAAHWLSVLEAEAQHRPRPQLFPIEQQCWATAVARVTRAGHPVDPACSTTWKEAVDNILHA